ncbi:MAG: T9SS C-terminal target domain-containing protein, partial [Crocinitomicaceae bacterium]|nr:T9SS C-terminal target domain-containing protein [Crocinitomicaceae bacterium]
VNATGTIIVVSENTPGTPSSNPTLCINTALTAITRTTGAATGIGTPTGLPAGVTASWNSNVITVSGTPTEAGTFNYSIPLTGGCGDVDATGTITVNPLNTVTAGTTTTVCTGTALSPVITHTTTGATGISTVSGLSAGLSASWSANTITISGTPSTATSNYSIRLAGGCGIVNATGTIIRTPNNTVAAASNQTLCINTTLTTINRATTGATGIANDGVSGANGLPAGVSATWASNTLTISGTPTASGTFNYSIALTGGCGTVNATGTITVTADMTPGTASSNPTLCINTALTAITRTTARATGIGTAVGLPTGVTAAYASNTITISGTPTSSGTFNYTIPLTGGCGTVNATGTITVTAANTVSAASSSPTVCINTALTAITHTTTGATGRGTASGLPAGVTSSWSANVLTISGTPTATGTFNYSIPLTGGCGTVNATGTITVTANMTPGTASSTPTLCANTALTAITRTTTGATGIGSATGLPTGVSASWSANTLTVSGTPTQSGTFNYSIPLTGGCGTVNATGTITVVTTNSVSSPSANPTTCVNTALTPITFTTGGATGIGSATGLPSGVSASWSANVITISGTPTVNGDYNYTIPLSGGCSSINATGTITVVSPVIVGAASSSPTLCINTALTAITHTTTNATGIGTPTGLPTGISASWSSNTITISGTPTVSGTFNYTIPANGSCGSVDATGTITVSPSYSVGSASSTPTLCVNTALISITHSTANAIGIGSPTGLPAGVSASWSTNLITISGTPTESGTFNYSIPLSGGCGTVNATGTITVTSSNSAGSASSTPTLCVNTALSAITHSTTGATGIGSPTGLPAGISASWSSNIITINGTPTETGVFNYSIPLTGGCGSINATGTITVSPTSTVGSASSTPTLCQNTVLTAITHSTSNATGIGTPTGLPTGVSASWSANVITISGTPSVSGTFNYSIPLSGGCGALNATGTITVTPSNSVGSASSSPTLCTYTALTDITHTTTGATGIGSSTGLPAGVSASWSSNIITISGTPTEGGVFNYSIPLTGGCGSFSATGTITVISSSVSGTISGNNAACNGTNSTVLTLSGYTGAIQWQSSTNNSTFNNLSGETSSTYTATNLSVTTYFRAIVTNGSCSAATSGTHTISIIAPSISDPSLASGDYVWRGSGANSTDSVDWLVPSNWYVYDGSNFNVAVTLPTNTINVFIPGVGTCFRANPHIFTATTPASKNLTILSSGHLTMHTGKLSVAGNWVNNGIFTCGTGEVIFIDQGYHTIGGTVSVNAFYDFRMNKPANGPTKSVAYLLKQATISGTMTLTAGLFDINVFSIDMDDRPVVGGSNGSYVRTSDVGFLRRFVGSAYDNMQAGYVRFPVGRSNFNQARLNNAGTSDKFSVRLFDNVSDDAEEASPTTALPVVVRTWIIDEQTDGGSDVDMQLYWNGTIDSRDEELNAFDYNTAYIAHYDASSPTWENKGGSAPSGPGYAQQNGITSFSPFTISSRWGLGYISPLPVELIDFKATCLEDKTVKIEWNTASENNSSYYDVLKSINGTSWNVLENVLAAGNSTSLLNYQVFDRELSLGNVYYKLKQVDIDGKFKMYDVINSNCDEEILTDKLKAYPNPSTNQFYIDFNSVNIEGVGEITISDSKGLVIYSRSVQIEKGNNFFTINELSASPGLYYINLKSNKFASNVVKHIIR